MDQLCLRFFPGRGGLLLQAAPVARQALEIREKAWAATPERLSQARNNYALLLRDRGSFGESASLLQKALAVSKSEGAKSVLEFGAIWETYTSLKAGTRRPNTLMLESIDEEDSSTGESGALSRLRKIAALDFAKQRYAQALSECQQALTLAAKSESATVRAGAAADDDKRREARAAAVPRTRPNAL